MGRKSPGTLRLKVLGNPGKRKLGDNRQPRKTDGPGNNYAGYPAMPKWLSRVAKREYLSLRQRLILRGAFDELDAETLAAFCEAWGDFKEATATLAAEGRTFKTESGYAYPHPAFEQKYKALRAMDAYGKRLGLDRESRQRLGIGDGKEEKDAMSEFVG